MLKDQVIKVLKMINPKDHKIEAIKAVRQFTADTFGITAGLRISKEFVDAVIAQMNSAQIEAFESAVVLAKNSGLTLTQLRDVIDRYDY